MDHSELTVATKLFGQIVGAFGHRLHAAGVPVDPERSARFANSVTLAAPTTVEQLYWLGRVTLLSARAHIGTYDRVFKQYFLQISEYAEGAPDERPRDAAFPSQDFSQNDTSAEGDNHPPDASDAALAHPYGTADTASSEDFAATGQPTEDSAQGHHQAKTTILMSADERLATKDFAACSPAELSMLARAIGRLHLVPPLRRTARVRSGRKGQGFDVRATIRRASQTAGEPLVLVRQKRVWRPRRVVLIADVSGSMEAYSRLYLHLLRSAVQALNAETFVFATRLTRLTKVLRANQPDMAYQRALDSAPDWAGGTRIGQALSDFVGQHGRRGMARGAIVVIVSDGWETQSPELIKKSMEELARLAHRIIWVNPRKAADSYQPLVGGMVAALPYINTFVPGQSYRALEDVVAAIDAATHLSGQSR